VIKIEESYYEHAVRIVSNGIVGSGCLIQTTHSIYSFIFTAKHCLTENQLIDKENIIITRDKINDSIPLKVIDVFLHEELDIAVILIEKINGLRLTPFVNPTKELQVYLFGYPGVLSGDTQILSCKIAFDKEFHSDIELTQTQMTFEKSSQEILKGFSGSGFFYETENDISVVGILTKLKAQDGAFNNVCAYHLSSFDELIISNGLPSIYCDDISSIVSDYSFSFTAYNPKIEKYYLNREIDNQLINYLKSPRNIWISGNSGIGKSLLLNRNLLLNKFDFVPIDLTTSKLDNIDDYFNIINNELIRQREVRQVYVSGNIYDNIVGNLEQIESSDTLIIFVDEVPIRDKSVFKEFLTGFIKISEKFSNTTRKIKQVKWIISTIINPASYVKNLDECLINKEKASKHFNFKNIDLWTSKELFSLIDILEFNLNFRLSFPTRDKIIAISNGIPNPIKRVIEQVLIDNCSIEEAIEIVKSEHI